MYNWGTFGENKIWNIKPNGHTALLTGSNGSGKTTLVDALVSLLVPPTQRHYNQSSGAERERNEQSYVRGAYGAKQQGDGYSAQTTFLRDTRTYSLLLAQFADEGLGEVWSIAQLRWFSKRNLKRVYIIAPHALRLDEHFNIDQTGNWRRELRDQYQAEITDSFPKYAALLRKHFGMRSEKALSLFGQTVGVKVLGNLNEFMRYSMLEEGRAESRFQALRQHYLNLLEVHNAIELATKRLELLEPIHKQGKKYRKAQNAISSLEETQYLIPAYFAQHGQDLLSKVLHQQTEQLQYVEDQLIENQQQQKAIEEERKRLHQSIARDEVQTQLNGLERQLHEQKAELGRRERQAERYREVCQKLDFESEISEALFTQNRTKSEERQHILQQDKVVLEDELLQLRQQESKTGKEIRTIQAELASLRNRRTNIPLQNIQIIRDLIAFRQTLENQLEDIHERVAELNSSLYDIDFDTSPVTYIRLKASEVRRGAVQEFRRQLRNVLPNAHILAQRDSQESDAAFHRVRELIERLSEDEAWRKRVTDVRNWLEFAGEECYRADNTKHQYYADSQSLSGGEKAKLAYTILASALVFQFGIKRTKAKHRSFRFAIVDEAFSKIDHENSVYALELFRRLNLQLMVVAPLDRLHIVEPYIRAVHFTHKRENHSEVINLSMKKFKELMENSPQEHDYTQEHI